jgi:hypothetical protein
LARLIAAISVLGLGLGGAILTAQDPKPEASFVANKASKTYHRPTCAAVKGITAKDKVDLASIDEAATQNFKPCPVCKPDKPDVAEPDAAKADAGKTSTTKSRSKKPSSGKTAKKDEVEGFGPIMADDAMPSKVKAKKSAKGSAKKADTAKKAEVADAGDDKALKFSKDIAPILAGNCTNCHNPTQKRGKFDMTSFQKLMGGSAAQKVIEPGKPDLSLLILKVRGEQTAGGKMPPGQRNLAPETIAKLEEWIKAGAMLDKGIDPTATLDSIAPSPEARRRAELAKLSVEERDKKVTEVGMERWKKASAKTTPTVTTGKNFLIFSNLPGPRAERLAKAMEGQRTILGGWLGQSAGALAGLEKISLYVFNDSSSYVEFVRSLENREVEPGTEGHGRLDVEQPYIAAIDPLNGGEESLPAASGRKTSKSKKAQAEEANDGPDRTLVGIVSENLAASALNAGGKPPRWLSYGLGAFLASRVDPKGSNYYRKLREEAVGQYALGWGTKANEVLGDEGAPETIRGVGFSLCECLSSSAPAIFPEFVQGMLQGKEKLDEVIRGCFGDETTREQFLEQWGGFVASRYRRR